MNLIPISHLPVHEFNLFDLFCCKIFLKNKLVGLTELNGRRKSTKFNYRISQSFSKTWVYFFWWTGRSHSHDGKGGSRQESMDDKGTFP